jgi:hypothetical protein
MNRNGKHKTDQKLDRKIRQKNRKKSGAPRSTGPAHYSDGRVSQVRGAIHRAAEGGV